MVTILGSIIFLAYINTELGFLHTSLPCKFAISSTTESQVHVLHASNNGMQFNPPKWQVLQIAKKKKTQKNKALSIFSWREFPQQNT